jgi:hypothetical protein
MAWYADTLWCDGCGVEIRWEPIEKGQLMFCCRRCLNGEECDCDDIQDEYPSNQSTQESSYTQSGV